MENTPGAKSPTLQDKGALAQLGERRLCKPEVTGSIPVRSIGNSPVNRLTAALNIPLAQGGTNESSATSSFAVGAATQRFITL